MVNPKICVLRAPGTNCDVETAWAFDSCGGKAERVHLFRLLETPRLLDKFQVLCIPGGFSYGDDIGAGVIFARQIRGRLAEVIAEFLHADKLVLGICNGFQVLLKSGILPDGQAAWAIPSDEPESATGSTGGPTPPGNRPPVSLTWNDNGRYTSVWVRLSVSARQNVFLRGLDELELPVAHAEGKLVVRDDNLLDEWEQTGQIALQYCRRQITPPNPIPATGTDTRVPLPYPDNPNGSLANIAGLSDRTGRVLGLMPHPERFLEATQHPQWTRRRLTGDGAGRQVFQNAIAYFA